MTRRFTDLSSQHSNFEKGIEKSDHKKQIGETSGIELIFENKSIMSEVDWKSKVFLPSRVKSFLIQVVDLKAIWGHFGTFGTVVPSLVGSDWHTKITPTSIHVSMRAYIRVCSLVCISYIHVRTFRLCVLP